MIYLIQSSGYGKNDELINLLKIGYTDDPGYERRMAQYKLHNPTCKILHTIPNLGEDVERRLQCRFKQFLYSNYGREWFYYD